jgi:hypothetical protein
MTGRRIAAAIFYGVTALISVALGALYLFRTEFMPYHATALGVGGADLAPEVQTLLLALMDVAGAGWAVTGLLVGLLLAVPFRAGAIWARWEIPGALVLLYVPILLATLSVAAETPAAPPWYGNAAALAATLVGLLLDRPWKAA